MCTKKIARKQVATMLKHREAPEKLATVFRGAVHGNVVLRLSGCITALHSSLAPSSSHFLHFCASALLSSRTAVILAPKHQRCLMGSAHAAATAAAAAEGETRTKDALVAEVAATKSRCRCRQRWRRRRRRGGCNLGQDIQDIWGMQDMEDTPSQWGEICCSSVVLPLVFMPFRGCWYNELFPDFQD